MALNCLRVSAALLVRPLTSPPIGQAPAYDTLQRNRRALAVCVSQTDAVVVAEIEFRTVAVQMRLRDVVVGAHNPTLEDRKIVLDRVGGPERSADVILD